MGWLSSLDDAEGIGIQQLDFLEKVQREQQLMGNANANEVVVPGNQASGVKKLLTPAGEDDDDDFFKRFAVNNDSDEEAEIALPINSGQPDDPKPMCIDTAGESFVVETGEECRRGIGKQVPLENQILLKDTMQEQIDQGDMDSEHSSNVEELVNVEEHPGSHTADDKHSALTRDDMLLDATPPPHGEQQIPVHVSVNMPDEHAGHTMLIDSNAFHTTSTEGCSKSIDNPDAAQQIAERASPMVCDEEQHPDPLTDSLSGRLGKEEAPPAFPLPREQDRGSPMDVEEQLANHPKTTHTQCASEIQAAQNVESSTVSISQPLQPEAPVALPSGVVLTDALKVMVKENVSKDPSPHDVPAQRARCPVEGGKGNANERPRTSIDVPMDGLAWSSDGNAPKLMEPVKPFRLVPAGKEPLDTGGDCLRPMSKTTETLVDPFCPRTALGSLATQSIRAPALATSVLPALKQSSARGVVSGTVLSSTLPKRSSGGCNRLQALVRTSALATQLHMPALSKAQADRKSAEGGHLTRSPFPVKAPATQVNRTAKVQETKPGTVSTSRLDEVGASRHSSFFKSGGHDGFKFATVPTSTETARTMDMGTARYTQASSTLVKSGNPSAVSPKQACTLPPEDGRGSTTGMYHVTELSVQPSLKTSAPASEEAPDRGAPLSSKHPTHDLQLASRSRGGTLRTAAAQLSVQTQKTSQMLADAQKMEMEALELQVRLAVHGNRLARLDNPIMLDAFQKLKHAAARFISCEE